MSVSIITYHQIVSDEDRSDERQAVLVSDFEEQVRMLRQDGLRVGHMRELGVKSRPSERETRGGVIISFDDGHASQYAHGFRILRENGLTGTFFVTTDWVGKPGYVTWGQLREMQEKGMTIGSHTMSHPFLPDLEEKALRMELKGSKQILEKNLGCGIDFISLPGGFSSRRVSRMAKTEGYRGVCTSVPGTNSTGGAGFRVLDRFMISRETTPERFEKIVRGDEGLVTRLRAAHKAKSLVKLMIGNQAYYRLWSRYKKKI